MNETGRCPSPDFLEDEDDVAGAGVPAKRLIAVAVAVLLAAGVIAGAALATSGPPPAPPAGPALPAPPADEPPAKKKFTAPARPDDERVKAAQAKKDALERSERALAKAAALGLGESLAKVQSTVDGMKPA